MHDEHVEINLGQGHDPQHVLIALAKAVLSVLVRCQRWRLLWLLDMIMTK